MRLTPDNLPSRMEPTKEIRLTTLPLPERTQTYLRQWLSRIETQPWPRPRPPRMPPERLPSRMQSRRSIPELRPPDRLPSRIETLPWPRPRPPRMPPERLPSRMQPRRSLPELSPPEHLLSRIETQPWPRLRPPRLPANNSLSNSDQWDLELSRNIGLLLSESQSPSLPSQLLPSSMVVGRVKLHSLRARIDPATATSNQFRCLNFPN